MGREEESNYWLGYANEGANGEGGSPGVMREGGGGREGRGGAGRGRGVRQDEWGVLRHLIGKTLREKYSAFANTLFLGSV